VEVIAVDKGALDCTIKARTLTAVHRAAEMENYDWEEIDSWNN
jgi:citrate lyase subunit gamma (acyl carrier protein)